MSTDIPPASKSLQYSTLGTEVNLGEMHRSIIRIERKLDGAMDDHEKRLRQLERWMWGAVGTGSAGFVTALYTLLTNGSGVG